jgi:hypothetical protein
MAASGPPPPPMPRSAPGDAVSYHADGTGVARSLTARIASPAETYMSAAAAQSSTSSAHSAWRRTRSRVSMESDDAAKSFASSHWRRSAKRSIASFTWPARV